MVESRVPPEAVQELLVPEFKSLTLNEEDTATASEDDQQQQLRYGPDEEYKSVVATSASNEAFWAIQRAIESTEPTSLKGVAMEEVPASRLTPTPTSMSNKPSCRSGPRPS